jgi:hypothetical protein
MNKSNLKKVIKKNKKPLLILGSILLVILIVFTILLTTRLSRERVVIKELDKINALDITKDEIDMEIKSSGELKIVEEAIKNYYKDFLELKKKYNENRAEALFNILTPKFLYDKYNMLNDVKKDFESKNKTYEENIDKLIEMYKDYKITSYIDKDSISKHNYEFYKSLMITDEDLVTIKDLEEAKRNNQEKYNYVVEVLDLLIKNKANWYVKEDKLYIDGKDTLNKYNELRNKVYDLEESK